MRILGDTVTRSVTKSELTWQVKKYGTRQRNERASFISALRKGDVQTGHVS